MEVIGYRRDKVLGVQLENGQRCKFFDIPAQVHKELIESQSPSRYFYQWIWNSGYEHKREWENLEALLNEIATLDSEEDRLITIETRLCEDAPLHIAAIWGDVGAVETLLEGGAEINVQGDMGNTPLHYAVSFGHKRCASLLVSSGASVDIENEFGETAREKGRASNDPLLRGLFEEKA